MKAPILKKLFLSALLALSAQIHAESISTPEELKKAFVKFHEASNSEGVRSLFCKSTKPKFVKDFFYQTIEETFSFKIIKVTMNESNPASNENNQKLKDGENLMNIELIKESNSRTQKVILNLHFENSTDGFCYLYQ